MEQRSNKRAKSSRCQDRTTKRRKKEGNEGNAKDMPGEGILSTFSLPRKNNDQEMNCKISRSQPTTKRIKKVHNIKIATTKRANKFIIQNIETATTPVVPIPLGLHNKRAKVQDVKIAPPNGIKIK